MSLKGGKSKSAKSSGNSRNSSSRNSSNSRQGALGPLPQKKKRITEKEWHKFKRNC